MLSELYTLNESLRRCGNVPEKSDPRITCHKKEDGFIIGLDKDGKTKRIEFLPKQKMAEVWKVAPSKQQTFPVLNLKVPVWQPLESVENIRASLKGKKEKIELSKLEQFAMHLISTRTEKKRILINIYRSLITVFPASLRILM